MPTINVEDGTIVANANSYIDVGEVDTYATDRGIENGASTLQKQERLILAKDYLEAYSFIARYSGVKTDPDNQVLSWPRTGAYLDNEVEIDENEIPQVLKDAQAYMVLEMNFGLELFGEPKTADNATGGIKLEQIGPLRRDYFRSDAPSKLGPIEIPQVDALISRIMKRASRSSFPVYRA